MKLIKWSGNWADEFDTYGFIVCTQDQWDKLESLINKIDGLVEIYFGTNEHWTFESPEELMSDIEVTEISSLDIAILQKNLGKGYGEYAISYGTHPFGWSVEEFADRILHTSDDDC